MNTLRTTAYAAAIVIATLSLASCDRRAPSDASSASSAASAPGGTSTSPSPPSPAASK